MVRPSPLGRQPVAGAALAIVDVLLVFLPFWCVIVPLIAGPSPELPLPFGGRFSGKVSEKHLFQFWALLALRVALVSRTGAAGIPERVAGALSPAGRSVAVALVAFPLFLGIAQPRPISGDTVPAKLLPISLLEERDLDLDEFVPGFAPTPPYYVTRIDGSYYSTFPLAPGLTAVPVYAAARLVAPRVFASWREIYTTPWGDHAPENVANRLEQIAAALIAALVVAIAWSILSRRLEDPALALWGTAALAFGTPLLSTASWGLWMHGPASLFLALSILLIGGPATSRSAAALAGGAVVWAVACRPSLAPAAGVLALWAIHDDPRRSAPLAAGAVVVAAGVAWLNIRVYAHPLGGYAAFLRAFQGEGSEWWVLPTILASPSRGLFSFCPFLLVPLAGALASIRKAPLGRDAFLLAAAAAVVAPVALYGVWSGGHSFGPRLLTEAALLLVLALPAAAPRLARGRWLRSALVAAIVFSIHLHVLGTARGDRGWTDRVFAGRQHAPLFWNLRDSQLWWTLR